MTEPGKAREVSFEIGPRDKPPLAPPLEEDYGVYSAIEHQLKEIAVDWTRGAVTDEQKLRAIHKKLKRDFVYSLEFEPGDEANPIITFLKVARKGHCEYFASSMALLSRSIGIPARVIGGYAVVEYNPIGDYHVVRERHAHAWVEAWLEKRGWVTFDPTPAGESAEGETGETHFVAGIIDWVGYGWTLAYMWFSGLTTMQIAGGVGALLLLWVILRKLRELRRKKGRHKTDEPPFPDPPPVLVKVLDFLDSKGEKLANGEALEVFAKRLAVSRELGPPGTGAARLLKDYAAWRYGGHGDLDEIIDKMERWLSIAAN
jgi:transglutaminase-like putative cysteine protease